MKMKDLFRFAAVLLLTVCLTASTLMGGPLGIDVSSAQGSINWAEVYAAGVKFAFAKATEGNYYEDTLFTANMVNGKAAGVQMGAYHYSRPDINCPSTEATYFWNFAGGYIKSDGKSIYPVVNFETFEGVSCVSNYTAWFNTWSVDVKAKTATFLHPVLYTSACGGACLLTTSIGLSAFIANPSSGVTSGPWSTCECCNAWDPCTGNDWTYWQYGTGSINGITGTVDLDTFDGTLATLKSTQGVGGN